MTNSLLVETGSEVKINDMFGLLVFDYYDFIELLLVLFVGLPPVSNSY